MALRSWYGVVCAAALAAVTAGAPARRGTDDERPEGPKPHEPAGPERSLTGTSR